MPSRKPSSAVLLVAHDPEMRRYIRSCLQAEAWRVTEAANLPDALWAMYTSRSHVDLVVADISVPAGASGVMRAFRENLPWTDLPILWITSDRDFEYETCGAVLEQPFNAQQLRSAIRSVLGKVGRQH